MITIKGRRHVGTHGVMKDEGQWAESMQPVFEGNTARYNTTSNGTDDTENEGWLVDSALQFI